MRAFGSGGVLPVGWRNGTLWDDQPNSHQYGVYTGDEVGERGLASGGQEEPVRMV